MSDLTNAHLDSCTYCAYQVQILINYNEDNNISEPINVSNIIKCNQQMEMCDEYLAKDFDMSFEEMEMSTITAKPKTVIRFYSKRTSQKQGYLSNYAVKFLSSKADYGFRLYWG